MHIALLVILVLLVAGLVAGLFWFLWDSLFEPYEREKPSDFEENRP